MNVSTTLLALVLMFPITLVLFHIFFLKKERTRLTAAQWEGVDYIWYGMGFLAVLLASFQIATTTQRASDERLLNSIQRHYQLLERMLDVKLSSAGTNDAPEIQVLRDIDSALKESLFGPGWPTGPILSRGRSFSSLNQLIKTSSEERQSSVVDSHILTITTVIMDLVSRARASQTRLGGFRPPTVVLQSWPYLLSTVIALRITKVTFKVGEKQKA